MLPGTAVVLVSHRKYIRVRTGLENSLNFDPGPGKLLEFDQNSLKCPLNCEILGFVLKKCLKIVINYLKTP